MPLWLHFLSDVLGSSLFISRNSCCSQRSVPHRSPLFPWSFLFSSLWSPVLWFTALTLRTCLIHVRARCHFPETRGRSRDFFFLKEMCVSFIMSFLQGFSLFSSITNIFLPIPMPSRIHGHVHGFYVLLRLKRRPSSSQGIWTLYLIPQ